MKVATILLLNLLPLALPAFSQDDTVTFVYPPEADHELLVATRVVEPNECLKTEGSTTTYRVFGDGRLEIDPEPPWMVGEKLVLEPQFVDDLLHSVDAILDLGAHHQNHFETEVSDTASFITVRLDRYTSPEHAIYLLNARMREGLEPVFEDLRVLHTWVALTTAERQGRWRSGPSWPESCFKDQREKLGHRVLAPAWCGPPILHKVETRFEESPFEGTDERSARVQERLRERLCSLPRGLQSPTETEASSSYPGAGPTRIVELAPVEPDSDP